MAFCAAAKTPAGTSADDSKDELSDAAELARKVAPSDGASSSGGVIGEINVEVEEKALLL